MPLFELVSVSNLALSTYNRYCSKIDCGLEIVGQRGRKVTCFDLEKITTDILNSLPRGKKHRKYRRFNRKNIKNDKFANLPEWYKRQIVELIKKEFNKKTHWNLFTVKYCEPHLLWAMDITEYKINNIKYYALHVIDLGSRWEFEPSIKTCAFNAKEVAEHLQILMNKHGAPLFLKRDNGSNLTGREVENILQLFGVLPLNSPPGCPQYNGVVEKSQGDIKRRVNSLLNSNQEINAAEILILYAINESNNQPKLSLQGKTPFELWNQPYKKITKWEREEILQKITMRAIRIFNGNGFAEVKTLFNICWRRAARNYMEETGIIEFHRHGHKSTHLHDMKAY